MRKANNSTMKPLQVLIFPQDYGQVQVIGSKQNVIDSKLAKYKDAANDTGEDK